MKGKEKKDREGMLTSRGENCQPGSYALGKQQAAESAEDLLLRMLVLQVPAELPGKNFGPLNSYELIVSSIWY